MSMLVKQPGILSLLQDRGRYGVHNIGLTTGGPLDLQAFNWANRLLGNDPNACVIELSFGGLKLEAQADTYFAISGAEMPITINSQPVETWTTHKVKARDIISFGMASSGSRAYIAVAGGFQTPITFGSRCTVVREKIGGLDGDKLKNGNLLNCHEVTSLPRKQLPKTLRPVYAKDVTLRVVLGYQHDLFDTHTKAMFFSSTYTLTDRADRMGMRLKGPSVSCGTSQMLSEGICHGAIQIPADGQPIVLLNDRQTIGGYPKIGAVIHSDTAHLAQCRPGDTVHFQAIDQNQAHNIRAMAAYHFYNTPLDVIGE